MGSFPEAYIDTNYLLTLVSRVVCLSQPAGPVRPQGQEQEWLCGHDFIVLDFNRGSSIISIILNYMYLATNWLILMDSLC